MRISGNFIIAIFTDSYTKGNKMRTIIRALGYERVYLPLCEVEDIPFLIKGNELYSKTVLSKNDSKRITCTFLKGWLPELPLICCETKKSSFYAKIKDWVLPIFIKQKSVIHFAAHVR